MSYVDNQMSLGNNYLNSTSGDRDKNLQKAIECYQEALRFRTPGLSPMDYASTQNNLGTAYASLSIGDRAENLIKAIDCYQQALTIFTPEAAPLDYAATQNSLGGAYANLSTGDLCENLAKAITCYQQALRFRTPETSPLQYAKTQNQLAICYSRIEDYEQAKNAWENALEEFPNNASYHASLARVYRELGKNEEAESQISLALELVKEECTYDQACIAVIAGNYDEAFKLLKLCIEKREEHPEWVREDPDWDVVRNDPVLNKQFEEILG